MPLIDAAAPEPLLDHGAPPPTARHPLGAVLLGLVYGTVTALTALLTALTVVSLAAVVPATLPFTLLLWAMVLLGVAGSPTLARWLLQRLLEPGPT